MNDTATVVWYLFHGCLAFLLILGVTSVIEHFAGDDW